MAQWIDLRSDTVTRPTPGMRRAMAEADVGDDMFGEDPTVNRLEAEMCALLGKPAAVLACSGTQSNQMAVRAHCRSGDELLIEETGHIANFEAGGAAALSGVTVRTLRGDHGLLDVPHLEGKIRPLNQHYCLTRLLCLENTTNHGGGWAYPLEQLRRVSDWAHRQGLKVHMDGARLFNACVAEGYQPHEVARYLDSISVCFSKGLGCPMGSILVADEETIFWARRARKLFGGALRQAGVIAAAALYALEHHVQRLVDDHEHARWLAHELAQFPAIRLDPQEVRTNLIFFEIDPSWGTANELAARLKAHGILVHVTGTYRLRACTHLDVHREDLERARDAFAAVFQANHGSTLDKRTTSDPVQAWGY
ncbi:MAG: threonine aldolase [Planctomycetaceae bacterium]|nr:MAG: threonine aldolase [Planctomycetaceae bacterium]